MSFPLTSTPARKVNNFIELAGTKKRRLATLAVTCLAVLMGWHVVFGHNGLVAYMHKRSEAAQLQNETRMLDAENERLQGHVARLQSDPDAIEHQAREELHYTRAGEVIYTLPGEIAAPKSKTVTASN